MKKLLLIVLLTLAWVRLDAKELRILLADGLKKAQVQTSGLVLAYEEGGKKYNWRPW